MNENKLNIHNFLPIGYDLPCIITINKTINLPLMANARGMNGFTKEVEGLIIKISNVKKNSKIKLLYNTPDSRLYTSINFICSKPISEEEVKELNHIYTEFLKTVSSTEVLNDKFEVYDDEQITYIASNPVQIPSDYFWLAKLFDTPEKQIMYEEFMKDPIIFDRLKLKLKSKGINVHGLNNTAKLPIHLKEPNTGELLISKFVINYFNQYQFAKNYLAHGEETAEFDLGKLLMLDPKFNDFVRNYGALNKGGISENFMSEMAKSIKKVEKNKKLLTWFENDLKVEEAEVE
jgi:hypothetical protein